MMNETPMILRETSAGLSRHTIQEDMLSRREIECVGPIDAESAYSLTRQLRYLERQDETAEITIFFNSPGGDVRSGLAIYDVMKGISCPVRTVCMGIAASMAAILFAAGSRREILPHGKVMIHDPLLPGGVGGSALQVEAISQNLLLTRGELCSILAECTGKTRKQIQQTTARDTYFNAKQAVDFGLADRIITKI